MQATRLSIMPAQGPSLQKQVVSWFWESYGTGLVVTNRRRTEPQWVYLSLQVSNPREGLSHSIVAVSTMRFGRAHNKHEIVLQGRHQYGLALRNLQADLRDAELSRRDDVLAAVNFCILFEVR
jgi:hypothetical protein